MQKSIIDNARFRGILDAAQGSVVVFDLSCCMTSEDCQALTAYLGSVIEEYGDTIRFIVTESEENDEETLLMECSESDGDEETCPKESHESHLQEITANILSRADVITITEEEDYEQL